MKDSVHTVVEVCVGLNCALNGSYMLLENIRKHYKIDIGVVSVNGIQLLEKECGKFCNCANTVFIDGVAYKNSTFESIVKYIDAQNIKSYLYS